MRIIKTVWTPSEGSTVVVSREDFDQAQAKLAQFERLLPMVQRLVDWDTLPSRRYDRKSPDCRWTKVSDGVIFTEIRKAFEEALDG